MDRWMDDFIYPRPLAERYAGYSNYIYPYIYIYRVPLPENELRAYRGLVAAPVVRLPSWRATLEPL